MLLCKFLNHSCFPEQGYMGVPSIFHGYILHLTKQAHVSQFYLDASKCNFNA